MRNLLTAMFCALFAAPATAQDNSWSFQATGYLWLPTTDVTIDTPRGEVSGELSVKDAFKALDFAAMGSFEARQNRLSLIADLLYFNLSADQSTPFGGLFDRASVGNKITALSALAMYRVQETDRFALDLGAGARMMWLNTELSLTGGALPPESISRDDNWIDPIIALRAHVDFDEKWFGTLYLDAGGFGVGSEETRQAAIGIGYNLNDRWSLLGGWRYLDFERRKDGNTIDFQQSGLLLGASYRF